MKEFLSEIGFFRKERVIGLRHYTHSSLKYSKDMENLKKDMKNLKNMVNYKKGHKKFWA